MAKSQDDSLQTVGVVLAERVYAGLIVGHKLSGELHNYPVGKAPADADDDDSLVEMPTDSVITAICLVVAEAAKGNEKTIAAVGIALPGLVRNGVVEEAPNLPQLKGARIQERVSTGLAALGISASVCILNDADAMAAGLASQHDKLDHFIRVWTLGTGIGYGLYPFSESVGEGGHSIVTLDAKENYCGCGGRGHLEGIMGHRSMRLRFLDMEPEEVFEAANRREKPDPRCLEFKHLWHKALAAATATSIHFRGPGRFFITGYNIRFLDLNMLKDYLHQMVKMSPLQGYMLEVVEDNQMTRVIGAAVAAEQAVGR
ncbi:ROK family protein [Granulicella sp. S156]|jgi:glucokinase|uniref:ROK family protein n=1 Tax=Granulicella sp. S156 TaxID=1747224 RepID=UPI0015764F61|nr:ROK family protein [Granulicella sp. S156]